MHQMLGCSPGCSPGELQPRAGYQLAGWTLLEEGSSFLTQLVSRQLLQYRQIGEQPVQLCRVCLTL